MELPASLMGAVVGEGEKYFFTVDCPIGVQEHIHICIKRNNKILLFSTCSSQTDTAFRIAQLKGISLNTFPVFTRNDVNKFQKDMTYVNCNKVIDVSEAVFGKLIKDGKVHRLSGHIDELGMSLIAEGSSSVPTSNAASRTCSDNPLTNNYTANYTAINVEGIKRELKVMNRRSRTLLKQNK